MSQVLSARNDEVDSSGLVYRDLTALDRCDRCGARALSRAHKGTSELLFCGHHGNKYFTALTDQGFYIHESPIDDISSE